MIQAALDPYCLVGININPESRVKVVPGPAKPDLVQGDWRQFLVKVHNQAGVTSPLRHHSPQAVPLAVSDRTDDHWLEMMVFEGRPLRSDLSGIDLEYRIVQLFSNQVGKRSAVLSFDVGQGTQDIGFRNDILMTFDILPTSQVTIRVKDEFGNPTTASFEIRDADRRTYPSQARREAPDFHFHPQVYRNDGETVTLPDGTYEVVVARGPEYISQTVTLDVSGPTNLDVRLERWIDPSKYGWWSGDHHIHAAGCSHYRDPSRGVQPVDMIRHTLGEDLKIGATLTWGPGFDYQKRFFSGKVDSVSRYPYLLRYDVEVSGFGSHRSGHLCLLRLDEQIPSGGDSKHHWPTLCLNTLRWAKRQGAVTGPAHSGWGLRVSTEDLPNYEVPEFDGIGANEYIVDVTHRVPGPDGELVPAVDFLSMCDTPPVWELNIWYHTLNAGFRTRVSGETDFPCIYGERVGLGRSYVEIDGQLDYDGWCQGIRKGRNYVSDGRSHIMAFAVDDVRMGLGDSELALLGPKRITATARIAAYLPETPDTATAKRALDSKPYWHLAKSRIEGTREVKAELIVNGEFVASRTILTDGQQRDISFDTKIDKSSWVAIRIFPSSHTNPIFVTVGGKPIRPSTKSIEWCLQGVENCWESKERFIKKDEIEDAKAAYDHARKVYRERLVESKQKT